MKLIYSFNLAITKGVAFNSFAYYSFYCFCTFVHGFFPIALQTIVTVIVVAPLHKIDGNRYHKGASTEMHKCTELEKYEFWDFPVFTLFFLVSVFSRPWVSFYLLTGVGKRYFIIDQQIAQHFLQYSECLSNPLRFYKTQIINLFLNPRISANSVKR